MGQGAPFKTLIALLVVVMVAGIGTFGIGVFKKNEPQVIEDKSVKTSVSEKSQKEEEILDFLVVCVDDDGYRTDLILLCRYNPEDNSGVILQIPRDTFVENNRRDKKINSAYGTKGKAGTLIREVEAVVGVAPRRYLIITFSAFKELVDEVGGVEVDVPIRMKYTDPVQNLNIDLYPGVQVLDGEKALMFMRFRKNDDGSGYVDGDIGRLKAHKVFYEAALSKLKNTKNILKAPKILRILKRYAQTDFTPGDLLGYLGEIPSLDTKNIKILSLPGAGRYAKNGISYFFHNEVETKKLVEEYFPENET